MWLLNRIDEILNSIKTNLQRKSIPPHGIYDKKKKKISVCYSFNQIEAPIEMKVIAPREVWGRWSEVGKFTFEDIQPYLSRPRKSALEALRDYANSQPVDFSSDMVLVTQYANQHNPKHILGRKPGGGSPYPSKTAYDIAKIKLASAHVYLFLQQSRNKLARRLLKARGLSSERNLTNATRLIIEEAFDHEIASEFSKDQIFYQEYILSHGRARRFQPATKKLIKSCNTPLLKEVLSRLGIPTV
jgi:hypothetical protein